MAPEQNRLPLLSTMRATLEAGAEHAAPRGMRRAASPSIVLPYLRAQLRLRFLLLLLAWLQLCVPSAVAQVSREYQLKAVFLLRLAQFTTWPAEAFDGPASPVVTCVLGENPFGDALSAAMAGETAHGRALTVQHHRAIEQIKGCHVVYLAAAGPRQAKAIGSVVGGRSILTVRDVDGVASAYDTIVGFATAQGKIKLLVNVKAAAAARLVFDSRLLRVAEIVE